VAAIEARWVERGVLGRLAGGEDGDLAAGNVRKRRSRALRGAGVHVGGLQWMQWGCAMVEREGAGWDGYDEQCGDVMPEEYVDGTYRR
jgi:hypothetical protein